MTLSKMKLCHYAECHCAEYRNLFIGMLNVVMLSVVRLNVVMLSVVAPDKLGPYENYCEPTYITWNMDGWPMISMLLVWQKQHFTICGGWIWALYLGLMGQMFYHCATAHHTENIFSFFTKQPILMNRSTYRAFLPSRRVPCITNKNNEFQKKKKHFDPIYNFF